MAQAKDLAVIVGSLRKESFSRKLVNGLREIAPPSLSLEIAEIRDLLVYNPDLEVAAPAPWTEFRERIRQAAAVLFVTPEYNRSVPGPLKNAIDVGSRPYGKSAYAGKPAAIISVSPGAIGGFGANHHLRQSLVYLNMPVLQQPEAYVGGVDKLIDANGSLINPTTKEFLGKFLTEFNDWIDRVGSR